jgi:hypothetical protein
VRLLQIVPTLPPVLEGVGGYAAALERGLAASGCESRFLVASPSWAWAKPSAQEDDGTDGDGGGETGGLDAAPTGEHSAANLARRLAEGGERTAVVHYVNYGYQPRGCPFWLVGGVARWRAASPARRLVTVFHELYATGAPWRSSFWLSPVQRQLAARLLRASDGAATSLPLYGRILARWEPRRKIVVAPVLSSVGEPAVVPPSEERQPRVMAVFGGPGQRQQAFGELRESLAAACSALDITEIIDLGPSLAALPERVGGVPVRALGSRPAAEVSSALLGAYAGFLAYPAPFLAKSSVFAAYCAHGLVPVCAWRPPRRGNGERLPFWDPGSGPAPHEPAELAAQARAWYGGHDLASQAAALRALLGNETASQE